MRIKIRLHQTIRGNNARHSIDLEKDERAMYQWVSPALASQSNKNALISAWTTLPASLSAKRPTLTAGIDHKQQSSLVFPSPPYIPRSKSIVSNSILPLKKTHHSY
jgi:hypothetical protein